MKRFIHIVPALIVFLMLGSIAQGQQRRSIGGENLYYRHMLATDSTYTASSNDTLPLAGIRAGGASFASVTVLVRDSAKFDVYGQYAIIGTTTWTTAYTDSLINTTNAGTRKEFFLRSTTVSSLGGLDVLWRWIVAPRGTGQGVSSPTYDAWLNWKP